MKQVTVRLPDDLDARLRHEADWRGTTVAGLVREAIDAHLSVRRRLTAAGAGRSGRVDVSERVEELFGADVARRTQPYA